MTSPLRRKRPTTPAAPSTPARATVKLLAAGLLLAGAAAASAQTPLPASRSSYLPVSAAQSPGGSWRAADSGAVIPVAAPESAQQVPPGNTERAGQPPRSELSPGPGGVGVDTETPEYSIQLEPPGPHRLFRLESEKTLQERMRQEARGRPTLERITFPEEPILSKEPYVARAFPPAQECAEPSYVCYKRLYFEQLNAERYGWDLGIIHPLVSAGKFYWDLAILPYKLGTEPCRKFECSAGYCLPGDPVPLLLYPPELSLTGTALEGGTIVALFAIFPG